MKKKCLFFGLLLLSGAVVTAQSVDSSAVATTGASSSILDGLVFWVGLVYMVYEAIALRIPTVKNWSTVAIIFEKINGVLTALNTRKTDTTPKQ
jgi:hypothetical protein